MADLPAGVEYGEVRWHANQAVVDTSDSGAEPDALAVTGTVIFTLSVDRLLVQEGSDKRTIFVRPVTATMGLDGILRDAEGRETVTLIATDSAGINPVSTPENPLTWVASFKLNNGLLMKPVPFELDAGTVVDLSDVAPTPSSTGTPIVRGPQGDPGPAGPAGSFATDATAATKGILQLAGHLGGTAASPTVVSGAGHSHTASQVSDSTTTGRAVLTATDAAAARTAIGAGTSNLALGTTGTTAKAGDYQPTAANISDSTATGRSVLTAADGPAARTAIGAGTSSLTLGTTGTTAKAGDYQPAAANISDSTATGRAVLTATDAAAARTAISAPYGNGITEIRLLTQAAYDGLTPNATTLYVIQG